MQISHKKGLEHTYPTCRWILDSDVWNRIVKGYEAFPEVEGFPDTLTLQTEELNLPRYLPELARLEWAFHKVTAGAAEIPEEINQLGVNPTLELLHLAWKNLPSLFHSEGRISSAPPEPGEEFVLVWWDAKARQPRMEVASDEDLLILKMVVEEINPETAAAEGDLPVGAIDEAIHRAAARGVLLQPQPGIRRDPDSFPVREDTDESFLLSPTFALQWHITQVCDLHCKHCYDRSNRSPLKLEKAIGILDDLHVFCKSKHVRGHVSFTGGNPLLYPHFSELYRAASERDFAIAVLGNPAPRERIEELIAIQRPVFFQVSLEGLLTHNDLIRGPGNFERVIEFLGVLRALDVYSMVMLTLTKDNLDQVLPLCETLRDRTDAFFFNRLSMVGEGVSLQLPTRDEYIAFLKAYMSAAESNLIMGLKDNLFNIVRYEKGMEIFGGCTGYGCGAAFNFVTVLSDGQVHACRKFPSPIGNIFEQSITEVYDSEIAQQYRSGCKACGPCPIRPVCGGCLAIAYSHGIDIFQERDPYCFMTMSQ